MNKKDKNSFFFVLLFFLNTYLYILLRYLASGSGDTTVHFWDVNTETPHFTCKGTHPSLNFHPCDNFC